MRRERRTHTTSSFGSMSLLSRMAFSTAPPSLPVALVRANILGCLMCMYLCQTSSSKKNIVVVLSETRRD